jgi:predicted MPP superfamily phosphohydrolase
MFRWLFLFIIIAIVEIYSFQAIRTISKSRVVLSVYLIVSISVIIFIFYQFSKFDRSVGQTQMSLFTLGLLLLVLVPKIIMTLFMFLEDIFRIFSGTITHFMGDNDSGNFLPNRRKFISQMALAIAAIPFTSLLYGMTKGKYNYKVIKQTLFFSDLPDDFDGFTITQISDVHSGSFDNPEKIQYAVDLINQHKTDLMLFTGDIVNTHAIEMHPWIETFNKIDNHQYGKFAVLGNHDYGEYVTWSSQAAKDENFEAIKKVYGDIGFDLLLNQNKKIKKGSSEIAIVGVENWGKNFKQAGDLNKASEGLSNKDFKILMSHDPSHWEYEVKNHDKNFQLTLSGHTHGLQFGIEIPGIIRWSPVQYVYNQWAGLYENLGRYIYVNRGFGFHAYPGRVGIWPEITVFELKKAEKVA